MRQRRRWNRARRSSLARWFGGESAPGTACVAVVPIIAGEHTIAAFLAALEALPLPDFLRLMVSSGELGAMPPLAASDLLALVGQRRAASEYVDRYIGLTGRQRSHLIQCVTAPEAARRELLDLFSAFAATYFDSLEPALREERAAAGERLAQANYQLARCAARLAELGRQAHPGGAGADGLAGESRGDLLPRA